MAAVTLAHRWGYQILSVSGGEPLLYPWLADILSLAGDLGMDTAVVTNGLLIDRQGALDTLRRSGVVAVSVDGMSVNHNGIRGDKRAFDRVQACMRRLAGAGIPYSVSCGVTKANVIELEDIVTTAIGFGAAGVQFHAVEASGRAVYKAKDLLLDETSMEGLYVLVHAIAADFSSRLRVSVDLVHRALVLEHPELIYAHEDNSDAWPQMLPAHLLGVLVMGANGELMPVCYGTPSIPPTADYDVGWQTYLRTGYSYLRAAARSLHSRIEGGWGPTVFNPSELVANLCHGRPAGLRGHLAHEP